MLYCQMQPNIQLNWFKQFYTAIWGNSVEVQDYKDGSKFDFLIGSREVKIVQFRVRHGR